MSKKHGFGKFLGAVALGAGIGMLISPDNGENNRKALKKKIDELVKKAKEVDVDEVKSEIIYKVETLKGELVAAGLALNTTDEILDSDSGFVVNTNKVFMKTGIYPKLWK